MEQTYTPPRVWQADMKSGGKWGNINRPVSGATHEQQLPIGSHGLQLYSMGTPNGQKVTIMLEELLALGITEAEYDAHMIDILAGEQFSSGFVNINPNSKIPTLVDYSVAENSPLSIFESGSILLYLAEKFDRFLPSHLNDRTKVLNWLFWLHGSAPFLGGGFGHFYVYAPLKLEYPINRFTMEVKRQFDVLDKQLASQPFVGGKEYSIADIATWPWYGNVALGNTYDATEFLDVQIYKNVLRWANQIAERPAVQRGRIVNRTSGEPWEVLRDRHQASDITNVLNKKV